MLEAQSSPQISMLAAEGKEGTQSPVAIPPRESPRDEWIPPKLCWRTPPSFERDGGGVAER